MGVYPRSSSCTARGGQLPLENLVRYSTGVGNTGWDFLAKLAARRVLHPCVMRYAVCLVACSWIACATTATPKYLPMSERYVRLESLARSGADADVHTSPPTTEVGQALQVATSMPDRRQAQSEQIRASAAKTLGCAPEALAVMQVPNSKEWFALGCGKAIRYECASRYVCCPFVGQSRIALHPFTARELPTLGTPGLNDKHSLWEAQRLVFQCYELARDVPRLATRVGSAAGVISVVISITATGTVDDLSMLRTSIGEPYLEDCMQDVLVRVQFAPRAPGDSSRFVVSYVFVEGELHTAECAPNPTIELWDRLR